MPIDSNIALGVKPVQIESPLNQMANVYALQNAAQSNQLNQLKMEEYKKGLAEEDQFKNALLSSKDDAGIKNAFYSLGQKGVKAYADYQKSNVESKKLGYETDKLKNDLVDAKLKQSKEFLSTVTTPEQYLAWHEANHADPVLGPALAARGVTQDTARAEIEAAMAKPGGFQELLQKSAIGLAKFTELNKPNIQTQNLNDKSVVRAYPGLGGAPTILSSTPMGVSPNTTATNARIASEGNLNRQNAKEVAKLRNSGDLTPEQNDALYGANGAVTLGKLNPYKINSRNSHILANAYMGNPNMDMNKLASDSAMMLNAPTMNRAYTTEQLPTIISNVVQAGKKVNYSDNKYFGKVQEYINGASNDPDFINYMTQRNDALLTITSIMRGNGATDQAHRAEIEASPSTMSPRAFDAWAAGQMKALEPRLKQANKLTRSTPAAPEIPAAASAGAPIYATNGSSRIMSTDGGVTWTPVK
jgi:hypothetical protein